MQFDNFFCYKDIGSKAFFTTGTLLMPLLENEFCLQTKPIFYYYWPLQKSTKLQETVADFSYMELTNYQGTPCVHLYHVI